MHGAAPSPAAHLALALQPARCQPPPTPHPNPKLSGLSAALQEEKRKSHGPGPAGETAALMVLETPQKRPQEVGGWLEEVKEAPGLRSPG